MIWLGVLPWDLQASQQTACRALLLLRGEDWRRARHEEALQRAQARGAHVVGGRHLFLGDDRIPVYIVCGAVARGRWEGHSLREKSVVHGTKMAARRLDRVFGRLVLDEVVWYRKKSK